jgi:outer membrane biosynthesis protein TonB
MKFENVTKAGVLIGSRTFVPGKFEVKEPVSEAVQAQIDYFLEKGSIKKPGRAAAQRAEAPKEKSAPKKKAAPKKSAAAKKKAAEKTEKVEPPVEENSGKDSEEKTENSKDTAGKSDSTTVIEEKDVDLFSGLSA